jgi:hypothetical protein
MLNANVRREGDKKLFEADRLGLSIAMLLSPSFSSAMLLSLSFSSSPGGALLISPGREPWVRWVP